MSSAHLDVIQSLIQSHFGRSPLLSKCFLRALTFLFIVIVREGRPQSVFLHEKGVKAAFSPARPSFFAISKLGPGHLERIGCERLRDGLLSLPSADHLKNKGVFPSSQAVPRSLF